MSPAAVSDPDSRASFAAARDLCRQANGTAAEAYRSGFFLPKNKREAIYAVAAFGDLVRQALASEGESSGGGGGGGGGCCGGVDGVTAAVKSRIDALYAE